MRDIVVTDTYIFGHHMHCDALILNHYSLLGLNVRISEISHLDFIYWRRRFKTKIK
jgi:hypothetical protein